MSARTRCANHPLREAAGRCSNCRRTYCRECVTPQDGKLMCASCELMARGTPPVRPASRWLLAVNAVAGILMAWFFFYYIGVFISWLPGAFRG